MVALADHVCVVIRSGNTPRKLVSRACQSVTKAGGKIAGFVMNRAAMNDSSGYYYYQYGGKYSKYSEGLTSKPD